MKMATTAHNTGGIARTAPERGNSTSALPREQVARHTGAADLAPERLEAEIVTLVGRLSSATYDLLVLIGELDARGTWSFTGALSCAAWLAHHCDIELVTARNQVRVARAMRHYSQLGRAMAAGDVSYAKARVLVPHLTPGHVDDLVHLASTTAASDLGAAIARWSHGHETGEEIDSRHHAERSMSWRTDPDGMVTITARLAPADAATICAVIDKQVTTTPLPRERPCANNAPTPWSPRSPTEEMVRPMPKSSFTYEKRQHPARWDPTHRPRRGQAPARCVRVTPDPRQPTPTHRCQPPAAVPDSPPTTRHRRPIRRMRPHRVPRHHISPIRPHPALPPRRPHHPGEPPAALRPSQPGQEPPSDRAWSFSVRVGSEV